MTTTTCPNCGHPSHDNVRCNGRADEGANPCACSWPDPYNYTDPENMTTTNGAETMDLDFQTAEAEVDLYAGDTQRPAAVLSYGMEDDYLGQLTCLFDDEAARYLDTHELPARLRGFDWVECSYHNDPRAER